MGFESCFVICEFGLVFDVLAFRRVAFADSCVFAME